VPLSARISDLKINLQAIYLFDLQRIRYDWHVKYMGEMIIPEFRNVEIRCDELIYLTANGVTPGGSSTVQYIRVQYSTNLHQQYIEKHTRHTNNTQNTIK